jgi:hypothetical protein
MLHWIEEMRDFTNKILYGDTDFEAKRKAFMETGLPYRCFDMAQTSLMRWPLPPRSVSGRADIPVSLATTLQSSHMLGHRCEC